MATQYILSTNGIDSSVLSWSKSDAITRAQAYVFGAETTTHGPTEVTHVIEVRTVKTGKVVFSETVTVPALAPVATPEPASAPVSAPSASQTADRYASIAVAPENALCGFNTGAGKCARGENGTPGQAVHTLLKWFPVGDAGTHLCGYHSPFDVSPFDHIDHVVPLPESTLCGYCDDPAITAVAVPSVNQRDAVCGKHLRSHYGHVANPSGVSALCPFVESGCNHTMAMNEHGYGVACAEWADAHGIEWRQDAPEASTPVREPGVAAATFIGATRIARETVGARSITTP